MKLIKIYVRNYKVCVQHENFNRCSLAPLARKKLVQPYNRFGTLIYMIYRLLIDGRTPVALVLDQAIVFRASAASEQCVNVSHKPIDWHVGTQKYLHQPEEPKAFIELLTEQSLHVINSFTQRVIVRRSTVQRMDQNRCENLEITGNICKEI